MKNITLKLTSLNPEKYPDLEVEFKTIDDIKSYAEKIVNKSSVQFAQKTALVKARLGVLNEEVDTRARVIYNNLLYLIDETKSKVTIDNAMVVTNPDGEEYIIKQDKFIKRYRSTEKKDIYLPIADTIKYIIINENIVFEAPWGKNMFAVKGAALNITDSKDIYCIQNCLFESTYSIVKLDQSENI
jgi:hypothetical protein